MATISKRTDSRGAIRYQVKIRLKGINTSNTFATKRDATAWSKRTEAEILAGTYRATASSLPTVAEAIDRYEAEVLPTLSLIEQHKRPAQLQLWRDRFGARRLDEVKPAEIAQARDQWAKAAKALAPATINRRLAALAALFTTAIKQWHLLPIAAHPLREVERLSENNARVRYLTEAERTALLDATAASSSSYLHVAVILSLTTGWRQGEIMGLTWDRVQLDRANGAVRLTLETSKNKERRSIVLNGPSYSLLAEFSKVRRLDTDLLFPSRTDSSKPMSLRRDWERALKAAGIENFRWHDMRHDRASTLAVAGVSLPQIGAVLGHKSPSTTARYAHLSEASLSSVISATDQKLYRG